MGCVVNGPGEAEGADVAICAGKGRGVIYVQGRQKRTVPESEMLDALYEETLSLVTRVTRGEVNLCHRPVTITPPEPPSR